MTMQTEHVKDELLQRHFDGDLDAAESAQLQAHLASCRVCSARRAAFARLADMISKSAMQSADQVDFSGMFARIERGIQAEAKTKQDEKPVAKVIPISSRWRSLSTLTAAGAGLAVAAAVLLMVYQPGEPGRPGASVEGVSPSSASSGAPEAVAPGRSEVVQVDFGSNAGTVFDIALADGSSTPVVWINDDE
jgi:anti-sigma factor RsiW